MMDKKFLVIGFCTASAFCNVVGSEPGNRYIGDYCYTLNKQWSELKKGGDLHSVEIVSLLETLRNIKTVRQEERRRGDAWGAAPERVNSFKRLENAVRKELGLRSKKRKRGRRRRGKR